MGERVAAQEPPWLPEAKLPGVEEQARSVEVFRHDEPLYPFAASPEKRLRGSARIGARLPLFGATVAAGCTGRWLLVGAGAWLCEDRVRLSNWPPDSANQALRFESGLPYSYYFVGAEGSFGYADLNSAEEGIPNAQLEPGFSVAVVEIAQKPGGEHYGRTTHASWLPTRDLVPTNPSSFSGVELSDGVLDAAWVFEEAKLLDAPQGKHTGRTLAPLTRVVVADEIVKRGTSFVRVDGDWMLGDKIRRTRPTTPPHDLLPAERWLDIDIDQQVLVAYEGISPVFATLVSTGLGRPGTAQATPKGEHRIWVKLTSTDMTNLEDSEASDYYAIQDVPWVMFFKDGYGLHGAFWHRSFGKKRSHGCVNLSPKDAQRLFHFAAPRLPSGWHAVHPTAHDHGTRVVVR